MVPATDMWNFDQLAELDVNLTIIVININLIEQHNVFKMFTFASSSPVVPSYDFEAIGGR